MTDEQKAEEAILAMAGHEQCHFCRKFFKVLSDVGGYRQACSACFHALVFKGFDENADE